MSEAQWKEAFDQFDVDGSGEISARELVGLLEQLMGGDHQKAVSVAADLLKESDKNEDGKISWGEFRSTMAKQ